MRLITRGDFWLLLDDQAMIFAAFLNLCDPANPLTTTARNVRVMWDSSTEGFDWDSTLIQQLIPLLLANNIITSAAVDRCAAFVIAQTTV